MNNILFVDFLMYLDDESHFYDAYYQSTKKINNLKIFWYCISKNCKMHLEEIIFSHFKNYPINIDIIIFHKVVFIKDFL